MQTFPAIPSLGHFYRHTLPYIHTYYILYLISGRLTLQYQTNKRRLFIIAATLFPYDLLSVSKIVSASVSDEIDLDLESRF